jgi:HSP20 family protein
MSTVLAVKPTSSARSMMKFPESQSIFQQMEAITSQITQRAFDIFRDRGGLDGHDLDDWFKAETELLKPLPIEMSESDDSVTIRAEVPGFDAKELSVLVEPTSVYIHGKSEHKKEEKNGEEIKYSEISASELSRRINLPAMVNPDKVSAHLNKGVLEMTLSKAAPPKKVDVKAA